MIICLRTMSIRKRWTGTETFDRDGKQQLAWVSFHACDHGSGVGGNLSQTDDERIPCSLASS